MTSLLPTRWWQGGSPWHWRTLMSFSRRVKTEISYNVVGFIERFKGASGIKEDMRV